MSINEYSAVKWRSFNSDTKCPDIRIHFDAEAPRHDFAFFNDYDSYSGPTADYRNGEFEMRVLCKPGGYAFSVNWSGLSR